MQRSGGRIVIAYVRTQSGAVVRGARRPSGIVDIGDACTDCGCSTSPGSGAWVNRIPSEWQRDAESPELSGYLCADCQAVECDRCGELTIEYGAAPEGMGLGLWCDDCHDAAQDSAEDGRT